MAEHQHPTFQADATLIDEKLAMRAHAGTSFSPEKRGKYEIAEFVSDVKRIHSDLMKAAKTEAEMDIVDVEVGKFQKAYAHKWNEQLASHSRIISPMITGPANFPVSRNQKACNTYQNRVTKMLEWKERAINAIHKKLNALRIGEAGGESEIMKEKLAAAEGAHERMKTVNKILRNKKSSKEEKVAKVAEVCGSEEMAREIMTPDYMGAIGFPHYSLSNSNANLKRMRGRVKEMQAREATPTTEISFAGGTIIDNNEDDRVQIFYDDRPSPDTIKQLNGSGWHWSPKNGVWQRKRTAAAMTSAKQITGAMSASPANHGTGPRGLTPAPVAKPEAPKLKKNVTLVETWWTQGEDSFSHPVLKTGATYKNLTQAQARKILKDNPYKNYDIHIGGTRVMLRDEAGRQLRAEYSPEVKPEQPPILTAPPELASDVLSGLTPTPAAPKRKKQPAARKPAPDLPPILTAPPELAADMLGTGPTQAAPGRKPAPNLPPILTAPPELAADVLGTGPMGLTPTAAPKRKPAARTTKPKAKKTPAAKPRKTTKKTAKPKAKKTAAAPKLTASQREYLAIQGFVMVKRGGKYIKITN